MVTAFNQYQDTQVTTASPEKILVMLYDGAINFTRIAKEKMEQGDVAEKARYIGKGLAIVTELMNTLNHEVGGEISKRLEQLYIYIIDEYTTANVNNSVKSLDNALKILISLRETWVEAIEIWRKERAASGVSEQQRPAQAAGY